MHVQYLTLKEKKKQRDEGAAEDGNDSDEAEPEAPARDAEAFMQSIGWVSAADSAAFAAQQAAAAAAAATAAAVAPFDYNSAPVLPGWLLFMLVLLSVGFFSSFSCVCIFTILGGGQMEPKASFTPHQDDVLISLSLSLSLLCVYFVIIF